ncbi:unnamed protein product [Discosporangium mesarthrocarpum]
MSYPKIGDRVKDGNGFRATVRYVGPVCTAKDPEGAWIGVEFDDPNRGKHDGAVTKPDGSLVRYFSCEAGGSGSFLKAEKVDRGCSMVEALRGQYVAIDAPLVAPENIMPGAYAQTAKGHKKAIEFYGETKIRRWQQVDTINHCMLREMGVRCAGEREALLDIVKNYIQVDLKANLLSDWEEVGAIASAIPSMAVFSIGRNTMKHMDTLPPSMSEVCANLRVLVINSCNISSWSQVALLHRWAPHLEELCAADNDLSDILEVTRNVTKNSDTSVTGGKVEGFLSLHTLDLSETRLNSWEQVACLSDLPALCALTLYQNHLGGSGAKDSRDEGSGAVCVDAFSSSGFTSLESLSLSGNDISSWGEVDSLNKLPHLKSLRFSNNPLTSTLGASEASLGLRYLFQFARAMCIARLAGLEVCNGSICNRREREEAEKLYLRGIIQEISRAKGTLPLSQLSPLSEASSEDKALFMDVMQRHPRYRELWAVHGEAMAPMAGGGAAASRTLASDMVSLTIVSLAAMSCTFKPAKKRLPSSMTISKLKQLCKRLFKLDMDLQQVLSLRIEKDSLLIPLPDDSQSLAFFGVCDGCEIVMNEVDERQRARDEQREREEEAQRIQDQLRHGDKLDGIRRGQVAQETAASAQVAAGL